MGAGEHLTDATALRSHPGLLAGVAGTRTDVDPPSSMLEAEQWDRFVCAVAGGDLAQTSAWAEAKRALGFETHLVTMRRRGELSGGALMVIKRFGPFGGIAYVARGPVVASADPEVTRRLLAGAT